MQRSDHTLPIFAVLSRIQAALEQSDTLVLQAAPGAGKTTIVPLALLKAAWLDKGKILLVEPRRLAAKSAAERMADALGEDVGRTVGYRVRMERKTSADTRIEVITYGMLIHDLQEGMDLSGISAVLLDEFHERPLEADLALAQLLYMRPLFRSGHAQTEPALKLVLMSATLDHKSLDAFFGGLDITARFIDSPGRQYPVKIQYSGDARRDNPLNPRLISTLKTALSEQEGDVLVFLPGQREIRQAEAALNELILHAPKDALWRTVSVVPLHGDLSLEAQRRAILPSSDAVRKIVLSTALAESSVTVAGVRTVVDSGLARLQKFDPNTGISRLETTWVSAASSEQRAGRAGRLAPGACYRLWSKSQQAALLTHLPPDISRADLSGMLWHLFSWGVTDVEELPWLDPPSKAALSAARQLLTRLGISDDNGKLSLLGKDLSVLQLPPRLALLLAKGHALGCSELAAAAVVLLEESRLRQTGSDLMRTIHALLDHSVPGFGVLRQRAKHWRRRAEKLPKVKGFGRTRELLSTFDQASMLAWLLVCAYPDRVAQLRPGTSDQYLLSNGRGVRLLEHDSLVGTPWLVVMDLGGRSGMTSDTVKVAIALPDQLLLHMSDFMSVKQSCKWHTQKDRIVAEETRTLGAIPIETRALGSVPENLLRETIKTHCIATQLACLNWHEQVLQFQARVVMARSEMDTLQLPDLSTQNLVDTLDDWFFAVHAAGVLRSGAALKKIDLLALLKQQLDWTQLKCLDTHFPEIFTTPAQQKVSINYLASRPTVSAKLQAFFGCREHPSIVSGRLPLTVELLSPAQRPIQITQDLPGFWGSSYQVVKKDMKGRYPKHPWPEDPLNAQPTLRVKPK